MQISSQRSSSVARDLNKPFASSPIQKRVQHASVGHHDNNYQSQLLSLPPESLNHITKYLDVPAFLALSRTCSTLHTHIKDDNTWHSAFNCQFLGGDTGYDARPRNVGLLRRVERDWMKEFVHRSNLLNRWERSRSVTIGHTPHYSSIHTMQLLSDSAVPSLLTASLQYGVVARSLPLSGKVIKGYIAASDTGLGVGNPNAEFAPNITACAITTSTNSAKTVWGYGNGEVAISHTTKVMDHLKSSSKLSRCLVEDEHQGKVVDVQWALGGASFLTSGIDGIIKVWRADNLKCLWKLQRPAGMPDSPCEKITSDLSQGVVAVALPKGTVLVWIGIESDLTGLDGQFTKVANGPIQIDIPQILNPPEGYARSSCVTVFSGPSRVSGKSYFGVHYLLEDEWFRISVTMAAPHDFEVVRFKGGPLGPIRTLHPHFSEDDEMSIIFAGDELGRVSLFDWDAQPSDSTSTVPSFRRFDAHDDGAITAISCTPCVIVTGSSKGSTIVWDALTFSSLRSFPSPIARSTEGVSGIIVDGDLLIASVEARVVTWKGEPVKEKKARNVKTTARNKHFVAAKWSKRLELAKDVAESRKFLDDEREVVQRSHSRERAQLTSLRNLGLDEVEAVEYVLMLSRDEEEQRRAQQPPSPSEAIFVGEFDEDLLLNEEFLESVAEIQRQPTPFRSPAVSSRVSSMGDIPYQGSSWGFSPSSSKVQVSPPFRPEPTEAGFSTSPLMISSSSRLRRERNLDAKVTPPSLEDSSHFPSMSPTPSGSSVSSVPRTRSISASPEAKPSSWSALLRSKASAPATGLTATLPSGLGLKHSTSSSAHPNSGPSLLSASLRNHSVSGSRPNVERDEDEDLRLAIELSLAESLSMQENK